MNRLKPFLLTTTCLILFAGLVTPVSSQIIIGQPLSSNVRVLSPPLQEVTPTTAPPPVSPNIIGQPPSSNLGVLLGPPLQVVTPTGVRTPIQIQDSDDTCKQGECSVRLLKVPRGKRLVVEYLSATTRISPAGESGASASILLLTKFRGKSQEINVGLTDNNGPGQNSNDVLAEIVTLYADPKTDVKCKMVVPNFENIDFFTCSITGFLEDVK